MVAVVIFYSRNKRKEIYSPHIEQWLMRMSDLAQASSNH